MKSNLTMPRNIVAYLTTPHEQRLATRIIAPEPEKLQQKSTWQQLREKPDQQIKMQAVGRNIKCRTY